MKIAAAYIRVSTEDQTELSPDSQIKLIRDYAKNNDIIIPNEFIFADEGISGKGTAKRVGFNDMITVAKSKPKPFECILLWKFSRFARSRQDSIVYKSMLRKDLGIDVISISEHTGDDMGMSMMIEGIIETFDEFYSINLAGEVKRGMTEKVSRGGAVASPPFGYNMLNKEYVINEDEAYHVNLIYEQFSNGIGTREIATLLNNKGITTKRGGAWENRTVEYILHNPVYIGKIRWNPSKKTRRNYSDDNIMLVDGIHKPIINQELWDKVQSKISDNKKLFGRYSRKKSVQDFMLRGIVKCSNCGSTLTRSSLPGLQCHAYSKGKCSKSHYITLTSLNETVLSMLNIMLSSGDFTILKKTVIDTNHAVTVKIDVEYERLKRVKEAYEAGIDTLDEYKSNKQRITEQITHLKSQLNTKEVDAQAFKKKFIEKNEKILIQLYSPNISEKEKNLLIRSFVDKIIFNREETSLQIFLYS